MENNYYKTPKSSWLMRLFWKACGADRYILERGTYSDQIKYFCLGGIVIATGVLAGLAGGYAIYMIFEPKGDALESIMTQTAINEGKKPSDFIHGPSLLIAIIFGVIWGLVIFNIDRFIVTSTGKGDGTERITRQEFYGAIPRIIMGLIIALTISKPIEIRMFKSEIDVKLKEHQLEQRKDFINKINTEFDPLIQEKEEKISKIERKLGVMDSTILDLQGRINFEINHGGCKSKCQEYKRQQAKLVKNKTKLESSPDYQFLKNELENIYEKRKGEYKLADTVAKGADGLLFRLQTAHEVAGFWISLFITLLFIVIELTPIFFKMMLIKGPYDYIEENVKELAKAEAGIEIVYDFYTDKEGTERHKVVNHTAELKRKERISLIKAQEEINEEAIKSWKEKRKKDVKNNPEDYISEE